MEPENASLGPICVFDLIASSGAGVGEGLLLRTDKSGEALALKTTFPPFLCLGCNQRPESTRNLAQACFCLQLSMGRDLLFSEVSEL